MDKHTKIDKCVLIHNETKCGFLLRRGKSPMKMAVNTAVRSLVFSDE